MKVIDKTTVNGAELVLKASGEIYVMVSPITGKHSVIGSMERAKAHWHGFVAANKEVPIPFAVYKNKAGDKIWYYELETDMDSLYFHEGKKPLFHARDIVNPSECKKVTRYPVKLLDEFHQVNGFQRLEDAWT